MLAVQRMVVHPLQESYVRECTLDHKKDALRSYIESGFTKYTIDNYVDLINQYRDGTLHDYMTGLIAEYGTDYKVVGEHVFLLFPLQEYSHVLKL